MDNDIKNCEVFNIDIENWKNHAFINIKIEEGYRVLLIKMAKQQEGYSIQINENQEC